jgi:hypothetical protein
MSFGLGLRSTPFLVNTTPDIPIVDNFNRANGALGTTSDGNGTWEILSGNFAVSNNRAVSVPDNATSGLAVINNFASNVTLSLDVSTSGGDALYFRVVDANNWWRVLVDSVTTTSTFETGYTEYLWSSTRSGAEYYPTTSERSAGCWQTYHDHNFSSFAGFGPWPTISVWHWSPDTPPSGGYSNETHTHAITLDNCGRSVTFSHTHFGNFFYTFQTRFISTGTQTVTSTTVNLRLQRCVGGTVTTIGSSAGSTNSIQVTASGTSISVRRNGVSTNVLTTTSDTHLTATRHGLGRGPSTDRGTAMDNFSCLPIQGT